MKIGFIGIGLMGGPLARNLIRAGKDVTIFARTQKHVAKTLEVGTTGTAAKSMADLYDCDLVFTCLPLPQTVKNTMVDNDGLLNHMKKGSIYIDTSTIDPKTAAEVEAYANERGIGFLGCTLGKGPADAEKATEPMFVSGNHEIFDSVKDILNLIGSPVHYLGEKQQAYAFKIISNMVGMTNLAVLAEGVHVAQKAGIDTKQFLDLLSYTGGDSNQLARRGQLIADEDFAARFAVDLTLKDLRLGCEMAKEYNYKPYFTQMARDFYKKASDEGFGSEDGAAIYKVLY